MALHTYRGDITLPPEIAAEILAKTQDGSAVMKLAKQVALPGRGLTIPVITGDPQATWVDETDPKPVSNPGLDTKIMQAYKLAVIVPFSNEFGRDAKALYDELVKRLPAALAAEFDATVIHGTAPGSNFDVLTNCTPQNIDTTDLYDAIIAADGDIATNGGLLNGFVFSAQGRAALLGARDSAQRPLFINNAAEGAVPVLLGSPVEYSRAAFATGSPDDVIGVAGDWTQAMYGTVEGVKIDISDQASLTISNNQVNLWERNMFAVRAEIEVGFVADTDCFNLITRTHV